MRKASFEHDMRSTKLPVECRQYILDFRDPDYSDVLIKRAKRLRWAIDNPTDARRTLMAVYTRWPHRFINDWGITYDPRKKIPYIPFILMPKQEEYIYWLRDRYDNKEDFLVEKSRDMGLTWLNVAFAAWMLIFLPNVKVAFGSRKEALVDRIGDPDSIFEKIRIFLRNLPGFLQPEWTAPHMKVMNHTNGASITGEAGDNIGRGGRSSIYLKDESAFYERPLMVDAALSQNSDCKGDISTPNGIGNPFYNKRHGGHIPVFTFHWRDDPRKDQAWYDKQKRELDPVIVAQEIDIDYHASIDNICIPNEYVQAAVDVPFEKTGKKKAGLDVADEGADANALAVADGVVVEFVEEWKQGNTSDTTLRAYNLALENNVDTINYDSIGVGAGVKGAASKILMVRGNVGFVGVNAGSSPSEGEYAPGKNNKDMFSNLKAELWWKTRRRFERTYEHVVEGKDHKVEDMISIPNDPQLIAELSQPMYSFTESGKIKIESKVRMKSRGVKSPNKADAMMLSLHQQETLFRIRTM